jgi:3-methylcrotonyl-CoA carboxylase alpha subunit
MQQTVVWPVKTNASFVINALDHPMFAAGNVDTGLIARDGEQMAVEPTPSADSLQWAATDLIPSYHQPGFRLNAEPNKTGWFKLDGEAVEVRLDDAGALDPQPSTLFSSDGYTWLLSPWREDGHGSAVASSGAILSPMPGRIIAVEVAAGDTVAKGQRLLTLEAMKMEHSLTAPFDGIVAELNAHAGAQVQVDALLARIVAEDD